MQASRVVESIRWIEGCFQPYVVDFVLNSFRVVHLANRDHEITTSFLRGLSDLSRFELDIKRNPQALGVLEAFDLGSLATLSLQEEVHKAYAIVHTNQQPLHSLLADLRVKYDRMIACRRALEQLTTPEILSQPGMSERVFAVEIHYRSDRLISAQDLSETIAILQRLYAAVTTVAGEHTEGRLLIVRTESGSSIKIDFDGILSESVKLLKDLLLECWMKFRHRKMEDLVQKNKATETSLNIISLIKGNADLTPEEKQRLTTTIYRDTLDLYGRGVLPADLPAEEGVDNVKLLGQFSPRLLQAPTTESETDSDQVIEP
jgi:hypothetical protein